MDVNEERLDALASSVLDGQAVDWDKEESGAKGPGEQASILALRDLSRIAEFNRGLQRSPLPFPGTTKQDLAGAAEAGRWGELLLLEPAGSGSGGEVWRAWDPRLQREVALKFLQSPESASVSGSLLEEARALAKVRHPNVVAVHGIDEFEGRAGMWMEFLHGPTLEAEIERRGALPPVEVARIGAELCRALEAVHAAGLVHGDIKPANIVLEQDGRVVLADFGLGRRVGAGGDSGRVSGTPVFLSPERLAGGPPTPRADLYALGTTLRFSLTGHSPFSARTLDELKAEAGTGPRADLRIQCAGAPTALVSAIERAMSPDPAARFPGAAEMGAALASGPAGTGSTKSSRSTVRMLQVAAVVALVAGITWLATHRSPDRNSAVAIPARAATSAPNPAAATYDVEASLVRRNGGAAERLANGDRVRPKDQLSLQFHATKPAWVYVLDEDERGESYLLFPQPMFDQSNPIPADSPVALPGKIGGKETGWTVTSRGGREHFLVVASPAPVPELEAELGKLPSPTPGHPIQYAPVGSSTMEHLRGVGGVSVVDGPVTPSRAGALERFKALAARETGVRGIWVRQMTLENP